ARGALCHRTPVKGGGRRATRDSPLSLAAHIQPIHLKRLFSVMSKALLLLSALLLGSEPITTAIASTAVSTDEAPAVLGWVEKIKIMPLGAVVSAKLDSGALTSSMHATDIDYFERDGEEWVRFRIDVEDSARDKPVSQLFERPLVRDQTVRGAGGRDERPVVLLEICIGDVVYQEQFALRDRDAMNYPALLGRRT